MRPQALLFDVDGTLTDAQAIRFGMWWRNFWRMRTLRLGMQVRESLRGQRYISGEALRLAEATEVARRLGLRDVAKVRQRLDAIFDASLTRTLMSVGPEPGLDAALMRAFARGFRLGIISDRRIDDKLAALGLARVPFAIRLCADDDGCLKPDSTLIMKACAALGVLPADVTYFGDRDDTDGELVKSVGANFVRVLGPRDTLRALLRVLDGPPQLAAQKA